MRPVLFMKRAVVQGAGLGPSLHSKKIWKNPLIAEKLLEEGFKAEEDIIIAYVTFNDDYAFIGKDRATTGSKPAQAPTGA